MSDRIIDLSDRPATTPARRWPAMLLQWLRRGLREFGEHRLNRRDLPVLRELDDHMLADIGLHRSDLVYIARHGTLPPSTASDGR
jgi:uncharacterized protein YjiS (DUF1127 family)